MIAAFLAPVQTLMLAQTLAGALAATNITPPPAAAPGASAQLPSAAGGNAQLTPAVVAARYAQALQRIKEPSVITFDYTLSQTGLRTLAQTHRVFRSGNDERDETLTVDGKRLTPPKVRIFRGRRNRYTLALLAPRPPDYRFAFVGTQKDGHHLDYVFRTIATTPRTFNISAVIIDGVRFLPLAVDFTTGAHEGAGRISFGSNARWWVPYFATARATVAADVATEQLTFYTYRFPPSLPPTTFGQARPAPAPPLDDVPAPAGASLRVPPRTTVPLPLRHTVPIVAPVNRVLLPGAARPRVPLATPAYPTVPRMPHARPSGIRAALPRPTLAPIAPRL